MAENNAINKQTEDLIINKAAGDPFVNFQIGGTDEFVFGVDDDDSDALKINQGGASPSAGTNVWEMSSAGERIMPLQPAFLVTNGILRANVTGDNTSYTMIYDSEIFDQGGDFDGTSTFTSPVTGRYLFIYQIVGTGYDGTQTNACIFFFTSNRFFAGTSWNPNQLRGGNNWTYNGSQMTTDMDAADTATIVFNVSNGNKTVDVPAQPTYVYASGALMC